MTFKWHYFQAYFALWANMVINGISGIASLSAGFQYIRWRTGLALLLIFFGGLSIYLAILAAFAAVNLIRFKWSGVKKLKTLYTISVISAVITLFTGFNWSNACSLVAAIIILCANNTYYDKRTEYFDTDYSPRSRYINDAAANRAKGEIPESDKDVFSSPLNIIAAVLGFVCAAYRGYEMISYYTGLGPAFLCLIDVIAFLLIAIALLKKNTKLASAGAIFGGIVVGICLLRPIIVFYGYSWSVTRIGSYLSGGIYRLPLVAFYVLLIVIFRCRQAKVWQAVLLPVLSIARDAWWCFGVRQSLVKYLFSFPLVIFNIALPACACLAALSMVHAEKGSGDNEQKDSLDEVGSVSG